jgi:hypothetical protein
LTTYNSLNQFLGFDVSVVPSSLPGTDGVTLDAWTVSQIASGQPHLSLVIPMTGAGATQYASVYVRKVASGQPQAFPGLVFSTNDNSGSSTAFGFSVVLDEGQGVVASSHNFAIAPINTDASNYGVHNFSSTFWLIWVSLTDAVTSNEQTVDLYPASYGSLASTDIGRTPLPPLITLLPAASSADFTEVIVSTTHP